MKCLQNLFGKSTKSAVQLQTLSVMQLMAVCGGTSASAPVPAPTLPQTNDTPPSPSPTTGVGG